MYLPTSKIYPSDYQPMGMQPSLTNVPSALARVNQTGQQLNQQIHYQQNLEPYSPWELQNSFNAQLWNIVNKQAEQIVQLQRQLNIYS